MFYFKIDLNDYGVTHFSVSYYTQIRGSGVSSLTCGSAGRNGTAGIPDQQLVGGGGQALTLISWRRKKSGSFKWGRPLCLEIGHLGRYYNSVSHSTLNRWIMIEKHIPLGFITCRTFYLFPRVNKITSNKNILAMWTSSTKQRPTKDRSNRDHHYEQWKKRLGPSIETVRGTTLKEIKNRIFWENKNLFGNNFVTFRAHAWSVGLQSPFPCGK